MLGSFSEIQTLCTAGGELEDEKYQVLCMCSKTNSHESGYSFQSTANMQSTKTALKNMKAGLLNYFLLFVQCWQKKEVLCKHYVELLLQAVLACCGYFFTYPWQGIVSCSVILDSSSCWYAGPVIPLNLPRGKGGVLRKAFLCSIPLFCPGLQHEERLLETTHQRYSDNYHYKKGKLLQSEDSKLIMHGLLFL